MACTIVRFEMITLRLAYHNRKQMPTGNSIRAQFIYVVDTDPAFWDDKVGCSRIHLDQGDIGF